MIGVRGNALSMFRRGLDTLEIARELNVTDEALVLKWVSEQRSEERGLPSPYQTLALVAGSRDLKRA